jgi:hypothetical protein
LVQLSNLTSADTLHPYAFIRSILAIQCALNFSEGAVP